MSLIIRAPGVIANPIARLIPKTLTPALHRITPARTKSKVGEPILAIPTPVGNTVSVVAPPPLVTLETGFTYARFDGVDDLLQLTGALSLPTFTTIQVGRLKTTSGTYQTLFRMMPSTGARGDLSLINGVLTFVADTGQTATHPWTPDTDFHVFAVTQSSGAVSISVDGIERATTLTPAPATGLSIGVKRGGGFTDLDLIDQIIYPNLTVPQRVAEYANLALAYGIELDT